MHAPAPASDELNVNAPVGWRVEDDSGMTLENYVEGGVESLLNEQQESRVVDGDLQSAEAVAAEAILAR